MSKFGVCFIVVYLFKAYSIKHQSNSIDDIVQILEKQGYTPNIGFSGVYQPGTIIQTKERGADGQEKVIPVPILFLDAQECFPGKIPIKAVYALPESSGISSASLSLGAKLIDKVLPSLAFNSSVVSHYSLKIENPYTLMFARGTLSQQFSEPSLRSFDRELQAGDKLDWFSVIQDVVAANSLRFELTWKYGTSAEERAGAKKMLKDSLASLPVGKGRSGVTLAAESKTMAEDDKTMVMSIKGPVIIAYRARPLYEVRKTKQP